MSLVGALGWRWGVEAHRSAPRRLFTLRTQVLGAVLIINVLAAALAGWVVVLNARSAARQEMAAAVEMADQMVREAAERIAAEPLALESALPAHLHHLRHVRVRVFDSNGRLVSPSAPPAPRGDGDDGAPEWFAHLVGEHGRVRDIPVMADGVLLARVQVAGVPDDEVAEVWNDVTDFAAVAAGVNGAILLALFLALGRVRRELARFRLALGTLECARACPPLARPRIRELGDLADGVNALASALEAARAENARLSAQLVTLEEDERRRIASELHDELGPLMFGLKAGAESVGRLSAQLRDAPDDTRGAAAERLEARAGALVEIVERMQGTNRQLLRRLRPAALGHVPLADVLAGLLADFRQHDPEREFHLSVEPADACYPPAIEATLYRCAQEGVTNALRHGMARRVWLSLAAEGGAAGSLVLLVADDGRGPPVRVEEGLGLAGMRERVRALGGVCRLVAGDGGGARLEVRIPLQPMAARSGGAQALRGKENGS